MPLRALFLAIICALGSLAPLAAAEAKAAKGADPGVATRKAFLRDILQYFNLGVCAPISYLDETRDKNGAKWMFRQQYVSGGAGWEGKRQSWDTIFLYDWNKWVNPDKKTGVWLDNWVKETVANGFSPWITMYNLAQSYPADYKPGPAQATPANSKNVETMLSYWQQVRLMMQICGKYPATPMVVQVEPDEWGHLLISGGMEPANAVVMVGSSGLAELKGLPDNLIGYASAWTRLRALYAPMNVLMCCNLSEWDARGKMSAACWARYMIECGVDKWDLAVAQFSDFDLGAQGKLPPYKADRTMFSYFDDFNEQLRFVSDFHQATGLWIFYWQVAVGNTYFLCENNTPGHFTDTIAQWLLEDYPRNDVISRYVQAGCAGFIFNSGGMHSTCVDDNEKDGITNPPQIPGNLGHKSLYADDDGGYMRLRCGNYYKKPYPILGKAKAVVAKGDAADAGASEASAAASPPPAPLPKASPESLAHYRDVLKERVIDQLKAGRHPRFAFSALRSQVAIDSIASDGSANLQLDGLDSKMNLDLFKDIKPIDGEAIAISVMRENHPEDRVLIAFFALADGELQEGRKQLAQASGAGSEVAALFGLDAAAKIPPQAQDPKADPQAQGAKPENAVH